ncbi:MAG: 4'-phosphopantetheinyl transferase superfamily protein [Candidatus Poribacteria bacterium]|nr:4'-phosphopantetheinyl transferase superfamily protein [Candidatus Poribacteria bacterium]MDE0502752.1 4'-phosphopantetheinyl transferase superfamily protein [Candidatus Poribacteria bacterium]
MTSPVNSWEHSPVSPTITTDNVHVWKASLDCDPSDLDCLRRTLTQDENARADRFRFEKHRNRFIAGRGVLRAILSKYLEPQPHQLRFQYTPYGKPTLSPEVGALSFNLSHSRDIALYAVTQEREIGVDVEFIRKEINLLGIAKRFFSKREYVQLQALPRSRQLQSFFDCWTRKEAFIKARGDGFFLPLHQFDVSITPGEPAALLRTEWNPDEAALWSLKSLNPGPGYAAALAVEGKHWHLRHWDFELA